jgi:FkbM family methyltransferase
MRTPWQRFQRICGFQMVRGIPLEWTQWLESRALLKHVLQRLDINCVLDVGANEGQFGIALRDIGYKGWILSFEPVSETFRLLQRAAQDDASWRVFPYALGALTENRAINVVDHNVLSSFLTPRPDSLERFPRNRVERTETVAIRRLDDVIEECTAGIESPRIYLKMDTRGFDLEVMKGAESTLRKVLALQTEVSFKNIYEGMPGFMDSIREFQAREFEVVGFLPVTSDTDQLRAIEMDCVMTRRAVPQPEKLFITQAKRRRAIEVVLVSAKPSERYHPRGC